MTTLERIRLNRKIDAEIAAEAKAMALIVKPLKNKKAKTPPVPPSCWGCGDDWIKRWKSTDLCKASAVVEDSQGAMICPDCIEEIEQSRG